MSTVTSELPESAEEAVKEATRIAAEAARAGTESTKATIDTARMYFDDASEFGRELMGTWSAQSEAALKAAFDAQNAAVEAGLGLFDLGVKGNRQAVKQFETIVKRTQQAVLESWQAAAKAATKVTEPTKR
jgi:hypothetical protein